MNDASLVAFSHTLPTPGSASRAAAGSRMRANVCQDVIPYACAASIWPTGTLTSAARKMSVRYAPWMKPSDSAATTNGSNAKSPGTMPLPRSAFSMAGATA